MMKRGVLDFFNSRKLNCSGQVTIFVIVAIVIAAGIAGYFLLREKIVIGGQRPEFKKAEEYYLSCLKDYTKQGVEILESQAGWIYPEEFP